MFDPRSIVVLPADRYDVLSTGPDAVDIRRYLDEPWPQDKQAIGRFGEDLVATYIDDVGATILDRNWHCRFGELDLVVRMPPGCLHVLEVRTRTTAGSHGNPIESITAAKAHRLHRLFSTWLQHNHSRLGFQPVEYSIDVFGVEPFDSDSVLLSHYAGVV